MTRLRNLFAENPQYIGLVFAFMGAIGLVSAIVQAHWMFGNVDPAIRGFRSIDGWINAFGMKVARIVAGLVSFFFIGVGLLLFYIHSCV